LSGSGGLSTELADIRRECRRYLQLARDGLQALTQFSRLGLRELHEYSNTKLSTKRKRPGERELSPRLPRASQRARAWFRAQPKENKFKTSALMIITEKVKE